MWAVVTVIWLILAAKSGIGDLVTQFPLAAFLATVVYATCFRPLVAVGTDGVLLRNVIRDVSVPWGALTAISTQYALTLTTAGGQKFSAWAAPAASRFSTARATPSDLKTVQWDEADGEIPASASLRSDSGAAAAVVRRVWLRAKEDGALADTEPAVHWVTPVIAALAVTLAATALVTALS